MFAKSSVSLLLAVALCPIGRTADLVVDASTGPYLTIAHAMAAANPGDRILVHPGSYPSFHFSRGVHVIGTGTNASHVSIDRVDFHPTIPVTGADTMLSNVTVGSGLPSDGVAISGNELAPGTLVLDGVVVNGGVYLGGGVAGGFTLMVSNSSIVPPAFGFGFADAAATVGGPGTFVEMNGVRVVGWSAGGGLPSGVALKLLGGTVARITSCEILAGDNGASGATAIAAFGSPAPVNVRLDGGTVVAGGDAIAGAGGTGIALNGTIAVGTASVNGGSGTPAGAAYSNSQPVALPVDLFLDRVPRAQFATSTGILKPGDTLHVAWTAPAGASAILLSIGAEPASAPYFLPFATGSAFVLAGNDVVLGIPSVPGLDYAGVPVVAEGLRIGPGGGVLASNAVCFRVDLVP